MESNNGNKKKKGNLYYAVIALFLILSGALGNTPSDEVAEDSYVSDEVIESLVEDNEYADDLAESDSKAENDLSEVEIKYTFRYQDNLESHYEKHGIEMGFDSPEEYLAAANKALANPEILHKIEAEDGDDVYYLEATNEFIVVSKDGYIRTYYYPSDGIDYFNRQ